MRKIIKWLFILVITLFLINVIHIIYIWSRGGCDNSDIKRILLNDKEGMIAILKSDTNFPKITIERFKIHEPFKYPFYSAEYYSDTYMVDLQFTDSLLFVADHKDTLLSGRLNSLYSVPAELEVYSLSGKQITTYYPDTLFTENIKNKPTISILKMLTWGPTTEDILDQCN